MCIRLYEVYFSIILKLLTNLLHKFLQSLASLNNILIAVCKGHTDIVVAFASEYIARYHCYLGIFKKQRSKFLAAHAKLFDVDEDVECTLRATAAQSVNLVDGFNCIVTASLILFYHVCYFVLLFFQRYDTGFLYEGTCTGNHVLMQLIDSLDNLFAAGCVAETLTR